MKDRTCENCHNFICKDMNPIMQEEYINLCLNSNRKMFVALDEKDKLPIKEIRVKFDKATEKWYEANPSVETTVCQCDACNLYYKVSLGHKCKNVTDKNVGSKERQNKEMKELAKLMSDAISTERERRYIADEAKLEAVLRENGWRKQSEWISVGKPPEVYRDEYGELIPFLVCCKGTVYPFRAVYDGTNWGDGIGRLKVTHWMPLPEPPKMKGGAE